jgi:hypothetical protein
MTLGASGTSGPSFLSLGENNCSFFSAIFLAASFLISVADFYADFMALPNFAPKFENIPPAFFLGVSFELAGEFTWSIVPILS